MKPAFVLDASVSAGWIFSDQSDEYTARTLQALQAASCLVPDLWYLEMANVLLTAERKGKFARSDTSLAIEALSRLPIETKGSETASVLAGILDLGRDFGLSSYDAAYLDLALGEGLPLATRDRELASALVKAGGRLWPA